MSQVYEMPKAIRLTQRAAERVKEVIARDEKGRRYIRLGVKNGGCAGLEYTMDYCEDKQALDEVVEDKGVTILIDPKAILFLLGTEMDFEESVMCLVSPSTTLTRLMPVAAARVSPLSLPPRRKPCVSKRVIHL